MHPLYETIHERFEYQNGVLLIKKAGQWKGKVGDIAGSKSGSRNKDRIVIQIKGVRLFIHQVIWIMFNGDLPKFPNTVDHKNTDYSDNCIENLREATPTEQQANSPLQKNNTSGFKGVSFARWKKSKPWKAVCRNKHIGWFDTAESAAQAYDLAARKEFGVFAKINKDLSNVI